MHFGPGALAAAFAAGFVSFVSPCVLPLIPGYLSFVSGVGFDELGAQPRQVTKATAFFVAGFAAMFVAFGAGAAWFGGVLLGNRRTLEIAAGIFIALTGLVYARVPLPRLLLADRRLHPRSRSGGGVVTPTLAGVAFAVGWTPCVGPTLAAILALAASDGHPGQGRCCSPSTRSDSGSRFCFSASCSRAASASSVRSAGTGVSSALPRDRYWSPSASCSRPESWCG